MVVPFAGMWIEIDNPKCLIRKVIVVPFAGTSLKLNKLSSRPNPYIAGSSLKDASTKNTSGHIPRSINHNLAIKEPPENSIACY